MKKIILLLSLQLIVSCKKEEPKESIYPESTTEATLTPKELGQEIFEGKGNCASCHQPDQKIIGPSIQEIATTYQSSKGDIVSFLKGNAEPIVDPTQFEVMKTNFAITKSFSDQELKGLEAYIYSYAQSVAK